MDGVVPPPMAGTPLAGPEALSPQLGSLRMDVITCLYCKQESTRAHWERVVQNKTPLHGPWSGWRMAGRVLVSPHRERITPERLAGLIWRDANEKRLSGIGNKNSARQRPDCPVLDLGEFRTPRKASP